MTDNNMTDLENKILTLSLIRDVKFIFDDADDGELVVDYFDEDYYNIPSTQLNNLIKAIKYIDDYSIKIIQHLPNFTVLKDILYQEGYTYDAITNLFEYKRNIKNKTKVKDIINYVIDENGIVLKDNVKIDYISSPPNLLSDFFNVASSYKTVNKKVYLDPYASNGAIIKYLLKRVDGNNIVALDIHQKSY